MTTDSRHAEPEEQRPRHNNESAYRTILNAAADGIAILDAATTAFQEANERFLDLFGLTADDLSETLFESLGTGYPPYSAQEGRAKFDLARQGQPQLFEWLAKTGDGRLFWLEVHLTAIDFQGRRCVIAHVRDISRRKTTEQAIRENERKFRQLAEAIGEVFWLGSPDFQHLYYVSPAYEHLWGRSVASLHESPLSWLDAVSPEDRPAIDAQVAALAKGPIATATFPEYRIVRPDGSLRWIQARFFPVLNDKGRPYRLAGILEDVTERVTTRQERERLTERLEDMVRERTKTLNRMNEELIREVAERREAEAAMAAAKAAAEAASQAKSEFLANISHEIRTPMNGILGMVQLLATTALTAEQHGHLADIEESASALLSLINDILDFSKLEAEKMELGNAPFDPRGLLESVRSSLDVLAREKQLALDVEADPAIPDILLGDVNRLRQILVNLVGNAIKFTQRGGIVLGLHLAPQDAMLAPPAASDTRALLFSVADTGIGINDRDKRRIFDSFTQADGSYTRRFGGTGLGLAISKRLVELMGGTLEVSSQPGRGSVFFFTVPLGLDQPRETPLPD